MDYLILAPHAGMLAGQSGCVDVNTEIMATKKAKQSRQYAGD